MSISPSRKVLSFLVLSTALVASVIILTDKNGGNRKTNYASTLLAGDKISISNPSWEDDLSKFIENSEPITVESGDIKPSSVTDTISISLLSKYLDLKQKGELNQNSVQVLINKAQDFVGQITIKKVGEADLIIIPDSLKSFTEYGEALGMTLKRNNEGETKNEVSILQEITKENNKDKLRELQFSIDKYNLVAEEIKNIPVPKTFIKSHSDIINGLKGVATGLEETKKMFGDPIVGLVGLQTYSDNGGLFVQAVRASAEFIKKSGISYKQGTGGYYLIYGI